MIKRKEKIAIKFSKNEGGGSKAVWIFSKNPSDLVARPFPHQCYNDAGEDGVNNSGPHQLDIRPTHFQGNL